MGWLTAIPRTKAADGSEQRYPARLDAYKAGGAEPPLPPLTAPYIFDWLMEAGPVEQTPMGRAPLSWQAVHAWRTETRAIVAPWEARLLHRLSAAYLAELGAAEDPHRAAPWAAQPSQVDHEANERQLRAVLG